MTTAILGFLTVLLAVALAVAGLLVVQRLVPLSIRESHSAAIGIIYAALYVMFGMMVGFSAYLVMNKYTTSQTMSKSEASSVEELYWLAEQLPEPERDEIQELTVSYARVVVDEEWPLLRDGQASPRAETLADELRRSIEDFEPGTDTERAVYAQELERVHDLDKAREVRLLNVSEGLPPILWLVLVSLGIDTILFTYFVGMKSVWLHAWAIAALTGDIALIIFTIIVLDRPFGGDFRLGSDVFELVLNTIEGSGKQ
ncbi:MAG: DUF4239 domain-containing protein [Actinobacteria bacterium]|nr:DUF4239 domain-containing protein [Actinomycetota bacterium]